MKNTLGLVFTVVLCAAMFSVEAADGQPLRLANPFYAMDTSFQRPGLSPAEQFDLVKELGFSGVAWHEAAPAAVKGTLDELTRRGLKMHAIYCAMKVDAQGELTHSATLLQLMETLKGQETIIWIHIGGAGPAFDKLTGKEPLLEKLRGLSDIAAANGLKIAIYPHVGEWTAKFGDATRLAKLVGHPQFGVCFNLCHCLAMGDETRIPQLLEEARGVLVTVTINGADSGVTGGKWDRLIQTLDKGTYDVGIVLGKLREIGFKGPIGFQGYGIKADARSILSPTMQAWRKLVDGK